MDDGGEGWVVFDARKPILTYSYSFGPAHAVALAVGGADGLVVVSPPRRVPAAGYDQLAQYGPVRALVASNAFHHLGIAPWSARFPDARVFAPMQSVARVERKSGVKGIRPLSEASAIAGPELELVDLPHYRSGEVLVRMTSERGPVWYVTDVILNLPELPRHPVAKVLFGLSNSAPGLRMNNIAPLFMVKDRAAQKRWFAAEFGKAAPRWLIPAHGDAVEIQSPATISRELFGKA
ncbi:MAG: hypothetical protein M3Z31_11830 [Pseudomonadota bacterium]|nr:hypothetical protein [Pseudomonadota bacterium]